MLNDLMNKFRSQAEKLADAEASASRERRVAELAKTLSADEQRAKDLLELEELAKVANVNAFQESVAPEADAIAKLAVEMLPHIRACERKWKATLAIARDAYYLAERLQVRNPASRDLPLAYAQAEVYRAVAAALADAGCDAGTAANVDRWLTPRADEVLAKLREKAGDE
jgi:hypothetical protein